MLNRQNNIEFWSIGLTADVIYSLFILQFQIYGEEFGIISNPDESIPGTARTGGRRGRNRKVSDHSSQTSPKRKESLAKKDRFVVHHLTYTYLPNQPLLILQNHSR